MVVDPKEIFGYRHEFFLLHVGKDDVVLDVACGTGTILFMIKDRIKRGYGVDYSSKQIKLCNKFHSADNLSFHEADVITLDYNHLKKEIRYNVAVFSHFLEHVENVSDLLMKVNADVILVCVPSSEGWYRKMMIALDLDNRTDRGHYKEYDIDTLIAELHEAGYSPDNIGYNSDGDIVCCARKQIK